MFVPLHYQVSEYDCVPTAVSNAISYLFQREEVPPMVVRHVYTYSLDTVGRAARMGRGGTSRPAVQLLGHWLDSYKTKRFSVSATYLQGEVVHLGEGSQVLQCLEEGGVALCNVVLVRGEEHFLMLMSLEDEWVYCFDSYLRRSFRGLRGRVRILKPTDGRAPNRKVLREWMDGDEAGRRFGLGALEEREALLVWRTR